MDITTEADCLGFIQNHPWTKQFRVLGYRDGGYSTFPGDFFRNWLDEEPNFGTFFIGRCSGVGVGSTVKYDGNAQSLKLGRFVAGGLRLRFLLGGLHEMSTISTYMLSVIGNGLKNAPPPI